jgi:cytoskeletal protein RodZ
MRRKRTGRAAQQPNGKRRFRTYALMIVCGVVLVSGFFFAARQHFSSMDFGMKNSKLRKQIDELQAEKRRLLLARETSLSPAELKKAAKKAKIGEPATAIEGEVAQASATTKDKAAPVTKGTTSPAALVVKTSIAVPAPATVAAVAKIEKPKIPAKRPAAAATN